MDVMVNLVTCTSMLFSHTPRILVASFFLSRSVRAASLPACPKLGGSQPDFDFVVVGSGVGGGPLAARLAENGFSGGHPALYVYVSR
jgi:choline dehydrogenase